MWTSLRSTIEEGVREFSRDAMQEVRAMPQQSSSALLLGLPEPPEPVPAKVCSRTSKGLFASGKAHQGDGHCAGSGCQGYSSKG